MFGLSFGGKRDVIAIVDVGSGSAAVGILQLRKGDPALIQAATRVPLSFEDRTETQTITALQNAIKEAGEKTLAFYRSRTNHPEPGQLYIVLRTPWTRSRSAVSVERFPEEIAINDKVISGLAKKALADEKEIDVKNLYEASVMRILLNGYRTSSIKGKHAHLVTVSVLLSDANIAVKAAALEAAHGLFPALQPAWRTHTRAMMRVLASGDADWRESVVVDIGTEGTSISVVRKGVLFDQVTFSDGSRSILHTISSKGMPEETLALLSMLEHDLSGDSTEQIRQSIAQAEPEMVRMFGEHLSRLALKQRLPNKLLLVVHPELSPLMTRFLSKIDFAQFTITNQPFAVVSVDAKHLGRYVLPGNGVTPDPSLSVASAFVHIDENDPS